MRANCRASRPRRIVGHSSLDHDAPEPVWSADQFQQSTHAAPMVQAYCLIFAPEVSGLAEP